MNQRNRGCSREDAPATVDEARYVCAREQLPINILQNSAWPKESPSCKGCGVRLVGTLRFVHPNCIRLDSLLADYHQLRQRVDLTHSDFRTTVGHCLALDQVTTSTCDPLDACNHAWPLLRGVFISI